MKRIFLGIFILMVLFLSSCGSCGKGTDNTNVNKATPTPIVKTNETAATDPALKKTIEDALKSKGFNSVTVDVTTTPATLRGTYPKGKLAEVVQVAQVANGGKPVKNEMSEEK